MPEHIKFKIDLIPVEEGLPDSLRVCWIRRKNKGCLRQASYAGRGTKYKEGWYLYPQGKEPVRDVTHYAESPQIGPTPCEEQQAVIMAAERYND